MNVLAIDDDDISLRVVTAVASRYASEHDLEITVKTVSDPVQAMLLLVTEGEQYDVVTLDVRMPKISGDEIFSSVQKNYPHLKDRILFITGNAFLLEDHLPEHSAEVVQKPISYICFKKSMDAIIKLKGISIH